MPGFSSLILTHVDAEFSAAERSELRGDPVAAFAHLERAHVLGQASTLQHLRSHFRMLAWAWRQRDVRECLGQILRIAGAATKTVFGLVPAGNTGGSNLSPFKSLPVEPDLAAIIALARSHHL